MGRDGERWGERLSERQGVNGERSETIGSEITGGVISGASLAGSGFITVPGRDLIPSVGVRLRSVDCSLT
eukprot:1827892-Rhodomonas_salina.2